MFCFKMHGGRYLTAGVPDIICCYKGKFVAFEIKQNLENYKASRDYNK